mmetsp:Transcript_16141/g.31627  ORF Transcript_16141/g.31627 Transcript_16141/m.31627 type:complete len:1051 (+) Transcript_16141:92-3244(+)
MGSILGGGKTAEEQKLSEALAVTQQELSSKISENEHVHMEMFNMRTEQQNTLETLQKKLDDLKRALAAKEEEQEEADKQHKQLTAEMKHKEDISTTNIKALAAKIESQRSKFASKKSVLSSINKQLASQLSGTRARFKSKVIFDDTQFGTLSMLDLPNFDRQATLLQIAAAEELLAVMGSLREQVLVLVRALLSKLSVSALSGDRSRGGNDGDADRSTHVMAQNQANALTALADKLDLTFTNFDTQVVTMLACMRREGSCDTAKTSQASPVAAAASVAAAQEEEEASSTLTLLYPSSPAAASQSRSHCMDSPSETIDTRDRDTREKQVQEEQSNASLLHSLAAVLGACCKLAATQVEQLEASNRRAAKSSSSTDLRSHTAHLAQSFRVAQNLLTKGCNVVTDLATSSQEIQAGEVSLSSKQVHSAHTPASSSSSNVGASEGNQCHGEDSLDLAAAIQFHARLFPPMPSASIGATLLLAILTPPHLFTALASPHTAAATASTSASKVQSLQQEDPKLAEQERRHVAWQYLHDLQRSLTEVSSRFAARCAFEHRSTMSNSAATSVRKANNTILGAISSCAKLLGKLADTLQRTSDTFAASLAASPIFRFPAVTSSSSSNAQKLSFAGTASMPAMTQLLDKAKGYSARLRQLPCRPVIPYSQALNTANLLANAVDENKALSQSVSALQQQLLDASKDNSDLQEKQKELIAQLEDVGQQLSDKTEEFLQERAEKFHFLKCWEQLQQDFAHVEAQYEGVQAGFSKMESQNKKLRKQNSKIRTAITTAPENSSTNTAVLLKLLDEIELSSSELSDQDDQNETEKTSKGISDSDKSDEDFVEATEGDRGVQGHVANRSRPATSASFLLPTNVCGRSSALASGKLNLALMRSPDTSTGLARLAMMANYSSGAGNTDASPTQNGFSRKLEGSFYHTDESVSAVLANQFQERLFELRTAEAEQRVEQLESDLMAANHAASHYHFLACQLADKVAASVNRCHRVGWSAHSNALQVVQMEADLDSTKQNYERMMRELTEHVCQLTEKLAAQDAWETQSPSNH